MAHVLFIYLFIETIPVPMYVYCISQWSKHFSTILAELDVQDIAFRKPNQSLT